MRYVKYWLFPRYIESLGLYLVPLLIVCMAVNILHALFGKPIPLLVISSLMLFIALEVISGFSNTVNKKWITGIGFFVISIGYLLNFLVIMLNNWRMPIVVSLEKFSKLNLSPIYIHFEQSNYELLWLSDGIGSDVAKFSPGDLLIISGSILLVVAMARRKR